MSYKILQYSGPIVELKYKQETENFTLIIEALNNL